MLEMTKYILYMIICLQSDENSTSSRTHKMSGTLGEENWEIELLEELASYLVYTSDLKIQCLSEFTKKQNKKIHIQIYKEIDWYSYDINEKLLMKIYSKKYNEYHIESEYEITDWAISSSEDEDDIGDVISI